MSWGYRAQKISLTIYLNVVIIYDYFRNFYVCHFVVVAQELNLDPGSYGGNAPSFLKKKKKKRLRGVQVSYLPKILLYKTF